MVPLPAPFPALHLQDEYNPAIRLFGMRFVKEQGAVELLAELLSMFCCEKRIESGEQIVPPLPLLLDLRNWPPGNHLQYRPPVKLNLKLFALLGASRVDTRHDVHLQQYKNLAERLRKKIRVNDGNAQEVVEWLEELLRGFQGAGFNRAWCAQTFFPITASTLTRETIWNVSQAKRDRLADWESVIARPGRYFSVKRDFLARGGELLYLQLCNALAMDVSVVREFTTELLGVEGTCLSEQEADPESLHGLLQYRFSALDAHRPVSLDRFINTIDALDPDTARSTNGTRDNDGWLTSEWCPKDSWKEGYLFAVELSRLLGAALDPVERLELIATGCVLQVLRSLCAQSARYVDPVTEGGGALGYAWLFTPPEGASRQLRLASQRNLQAVQRLIQRALRNDELKLNAQQDPRISVERLYREADTRYGHKLFLSLGKKMGLIVPMRGPGARFVMTDEVLRYLVITLLRPGERCTYEDFLRRLYLHHGIAVEGEALTDAAVWSGLPANSSIQPTNGSWLAASLRAGGFLAELSDACSIVRNTYHLAELEGTE